MRLLLQLDLPAEARFLPRTRRTIADYLEEVGADADDSADVVLAMEEACANVVRHAFPQGTTGTIHLRAELGPDSVEVQVEDHGVGFDAFSAPFQEAELEDLSGRGLRIIREVMSSVDVESPTNTGGTRLRMAKQLHARPAAAPGANAEPARAERHR